MIQRPLDIITGNNDLEPLYTYRKFPTFMGCVEANSDVLTDILEDMTWNISRSSGMIQLNPLPPLDSVYPISHGSGTTGKLWNEHHTEFSKFINKYSPKNIVEIGGGHGILAKKYLTMDANVKWTIIEPNPSIPSNLPVTVVRRFFDNTFKSDENYDSILHSHFLEHVYDIDAFFKHVSSVAKYGTKMMFSIPHLQIMLERKYTNCINFEHTMLITDPYIKYLFSKHGFNMVERQHFKDDHSIFYCAEKVNSAAPYELSPNLYKENKQTFTDYIKYYKQEITRINSELDKCNLPVYLFGAHVFSQYLISYGLNTSKIRCILDNDPFKFGKRLYGTTIRIDSPKNLSEDPCLIILKAGVYNEEIKNDLKNKNIQYIE